MSTAIKSIIQFRRGLSTDWTTANPILADYEYAYETDTGKRKRGDGVTAWNSLGYDSGFAGTIPASAVDFTPGSSGLSSTNVQAALVELANKSIPGAQAAISHSSGPTVTLLTMPAGKRITEVLLYIDTPFSAGATVSVGIPGTPNLLMASADVNPLIVSTWATDPGWVSSGGEIVQVYIGGSPAAGAGSVLLRYD